MGFGDGGVRLLEVLSVACVLAGVCVLVAGAYVAFGTLHLDLSHGTVGLYVGRLDPYSDPECGCRLTTVFTGDLSSPTVIEGTFESSGSTPMHPLTKGTWKVKRTSL